MMLAVQATGAVAVESPYRRRRVYIATWGFAIGQAVKFGELHGIILARQRTAMGRELYHLWVMRGAADRPYRTIRKEFLIPISQNCAFK